MSFTEGQLVAMQSICELLSQTLHSTSELQRKAAEEQLKLYAKQEGFLLLLLCIIGQGGSNAQGGNNAAFVGGNGGVEMSLRQSAAIYFKNRMMKVWPPGYDDEKEASAVSEEDPGVLKYLSLNEQQNLRDQVLPVYLYAPPTIQ